MYYNQYKFTKKIHDLQCLQKSKFKMYVGLTLKNLQDLLISLVLLVIDIFSLSLRENHKYAIDT